MIFCQSNARTNKARFNFTPDKCCDKPSIVNMDYRKDSLKMVNRCCTNHQCHAHWFGPLGEIKKYTKKQWDAWMNDPDDAVKLSNAA